MVSSIAQIVEDIVSAGLLRLRLPAETSAHAHDHLGGHDRAWCHGRPGRRAAAAFGWRGAGRLGYGAAHRAVACGIAGRGAEVRRPVTTAAARRRRAVRTVAKNVTRSADVSASGDATAISGAPDAAAKSAAAQRAPVTRPRLRERPRPGCRPTAFCGCRAQDAGVVGGENGW